MRAFADTRDGALWMGTNGGGLVRYREGSCTNLTRRDGLPSDLIRWLYQDADGWLWVGTEGRGLARLDPRAWTGTTSTMPNADRRIVRIGRENGLYDEVIHQILEAHQAAPIPVTLPNDGRASWTVLVVSAEADLCRYVRECLRDRAEVRVRDAASIDTAVALAEDGPVSLLIVDARERAILGALAHLRAILIVDNVVGAFPMPRVRLLERPFTAEGLLAEVSLQLYRPPGYQP